ncbi:MAG: lipoate--protein ligase family protein [Synechococcales cyanobacterium]
MSQPLGLDLGMQHASGSQHMAWDAAMLAQVVQGIWPDPVLRFYTWSSPTLSLGRHQAPESLPLAPDLPWVQRPTGGRAVLHGAGLDLTYALVWRPGSGSRRQVYAHLSRFLQTGLAPWLSLRLGAEDPYARQANCFASHTHADLVAEGFKVVGSAQLWQHGVVLQHGTILVDPDLEQWGQVLPGSQVRGLYELSGSRPTLTVLCDHLRQAAAELLGCQWRAEEQLMVPSLALASEALSDH